MMHAADAALRPEMRIEIAKLHQRLGETMVYVTHDQVEGMTLADKIVVLKDGAIQQVGSPIDLYEKPANLFVAHFLGSPKMNTSTPRSASDSTRRHCIFSMAPAWPCDKPPAGL